MIDKMIDEIEIAIKNELYISALALALTIPDICGKAEYPNDTNKRRYIQWFDKYIGKYEKADSEHSIDMPFMNGELIYSLRNCLLHQGTPNIEREKIQEERCKVDRFILSITDYWDAGYSRITYGKNMEITERLIEINIVNLCYKICKVADSYYQNNKYQFGFIAYELIDKRKPKE